MGGKGVIRSCRALTDGQEATLTFGCNKYRLWGANGSLEGSVNEFNIHKANSEIDGPHGVYPRYVLQKGDVLKLMMATGGGYGDPPLRQPRKTEKSFGDHQSFFPPPPNQNTITYPIKSPKISSKLGPLTSFKS
ncbi:hydantoinase B/oxoprolinase family protein [Lentibacillus kimchii]|uniref:Hydantoinase B/oxoprolinase family protein n=1 Tax=Lentibacillus kimchii TaxID=1542911 RepID=A0ABW2UX96_9BACI